MNQEQSSVFIKCNHCDSFSIFCNRDKCWEAKGLSSRLIEKQMKQIQVNEIIIMHPIDANDFKGCYQIVTNNKWEHRLNEMKQYGFIWERIINNWNELSVMLVNKQNDEIFIKLASLDLIGGDLKKFSGSPSFIYNREYIIGSHLVQPKLQSDETDLCPCVILDNLPNVKINYYFPNGKVKGIKSSLFNYPNKYLLSSTDSPLITSIVEKLDLHVRSDTKTWYTTSFHLCPHFIFSDTLTDISSYYFCQVYQLDESKDIGYCLISIPPHHPLNPAYSTNNNFLIEYEGFKYTVSPEPVKLNTLYMTDGLLNACEDDVQINDLINNFSTQAI